LSNSRERLLAAQPLATLLEAHVAKSDADSSTRHEHNLVPVRAKGDHRLDHAREELQPRREREL
jgi:hypothetical protein